jgi:hypothetical protein
VNVGENEFLQYVVSAPSNQIRFSLMDATTNEVILSDRAKPTTMQPTTFTRLWPVVGDRPQPSSAIILAMNFIEPPYLYTLQVQRKKADGAWKAEIDIDFDSSGGGDWYLYSFHVVAQ